MNDEFYSKSRKTHPDEFGVYNLTEDEKVWLGLKRRPVKRGNILIAVPVHYTSSSCEWHTEWISDLMLPKYRVVHPNLQVLEVRRVK